ncbi:MAG: hypothetical protein KJN71_09720, partial [Acidimicrobiia bacterium]|nr:hypothetical protein [Acidimicrobiia bacterium]
MTTTDQQTRFLIPPEALAGLGSYAHTVGPLSVLSTDPLPDAVVESLMQRGILDSVDRVNARFSPVLDVMAEPAALAQVHVVGGGSLVEFTVHAASRGSVSAVATPEGLELAAPAEVDGAMRLLTQHVGFSMLTGLTLSVDVELRHAIAFSATIDHYRRRNLEGFLGGTPGGQPPADRQAVRELLSVTDARWFVPLVGGLTGADAAAADVDGLSGELDHAASQIATRFPLFDRVITVSSAATIGGGEHAASQVMIIQAGVHDLLVVEASQEGVRFTTLP